MKQIIAGFTAALVGLTTALAGSALACEPGIPLRNKTSSGNADATATLPLKLRPQPRTPIIIGQNASESANQATRELPAEVNTVVEGNNAFAFDLYNKLRNQQGNLFFSPYSISTALAMTYAGARGPTATEMAKVLHFTKEPENLHSSFATLIARLISSNPQGYQLSIANRLWGQKGYGFSDAFLKTSQNNYGAGLEQVDFAGATEQAGRTINSWVAKKTQNKIENLIEQGILTSNTKLVLTNAIYFKGAWASQFNPKDTKQEAFSVTATQQVKVPMMYQEAAVPFADLEELQLLELPYADSDISMVILLPKKVNGVEQLEQQLTPENLQKWLSSVREGGNVKIWLPKFKVDSGIELSDVLSSMGMAIAFSKTADFSGISPKKELSISKIIHKTFVDVDELGTEAAATTGVLMARGGSGQFRADHPFLFLIRDNRSESILFVGRMVNALE